jgi:hypothetical protein
VVRQFVTVEVKSGSRTRAKSLAAYMTRYNPERGSLKQLCKNEVQLLNCEPLAKLFRRTEFKRAYLYATAATHMIAWR